MKNFNRFCLFFLLSGIFIQIYSQVPPTPTNLTAQESNWQNFVYVKLNWTFTNSGSFDNAKFNIYRKNGAVSDTGSFELKYSNVEINQWIDEYVTHGQTYSYYVTAVNHSGESSPSDTVQITIDLPLAKGTVSGTVKDLISGSGIYNAAVYFYPVWGWDLVKTFTDSSGNYSVNLYPGTYIEYTKADGYIPQFYDGSFDIAHATKINVVSAGSLTVDINLQSEPPLNSYTLSGTITDTLGNGLKAIIEVKNVSYNSYCESNTQTVTDDSGKYSVRVFQGDTVVVFAKAINNEYIPQFYNNKSSYIDADRIAISGDTANINFILQHKPIPNNSVSGTIKVNDTTNVTGIVIAIRLRTTNEFWQKYAETTDSLGNFSFTHILPGTYIFLALPEGEYSPTFYRVDGQTTLRWEMADSVLVDSNSVLTGINFFVTPESNSGADFVTGNVSDNNYSPLSGAFVFATNSNQEIAGFAITDKNGNFVIPGLIPGSYAIDADLFGYTSNQSSNVVLDYNTNYSGTASFVLAPEGVTDVQGTVTLPKDYKLNQNYPNPFNPTTIISYELPTNSFVTLKVYNIIGQEVATLVNRDVQAGKHRVTFNAANLASGIYFYRIKADSFVQIKKMILLK